MNWMTERDRMEIYDVAGKMRVPFAPILSTKELLESPQLKSREFFVEIDHPETGRLTYPGAPFKMSETPWQTGRAPLLGEDNEEIYCGRLGYSREDLMRLRSQGII
jgi:crotonobetainyl-CoA:carnitine CoA-transferase CaiB-like acyl-CoA transferase